MNAFNDLKTGTKLIGGFMAVALILAVVAVLGYLNMKSINDGMTTMYYDRLVPVKQLGDAETALYALRGDLYKYMLIADERDAIEEEIAASSATVNEQIAAFRASYLVQEEKDGLAKFDAAWATYQKEYAEVVRLVKAGDQSAALESLKQGGATFNARQAVGQTLSDLADINVKIADETNTQGDVTFAQASTTAAAAGVIGVLAAIAFGVIISRSITTPLGRGVHMIQEMSQGHLGTRLRMERRDEIGVLAATMDRFADDLQTTVIGAMKKIADGDLSASVTAKDSQDEISPALQQTLETLRGLVAEANRLTQAAVAGKLATRGETVRFKGAYRDIVQGVNDTLDAVIGPLNVAAGYVDRIAKGDIPQPITDNYNGDFNTIKNNLNQCIAAVNALVADANLLSRAAVEGKLATRADATRHQGDFRRIVQGVNDTLDAVIGPLNVAADYVDRIARGDIPQPITDKYNGDFDAFKNNLNRLSASLRQILGSIRDATNNVNSAAAEILAATTQQASGASEQSAAISQTTTTVDEVKTISEQAIARAQEVANASQRTVDVSRNGQRAMQDTIESMAQIKERVEGIAENILALSEQTQQIGEIIATVNEIASQSNMLALNASVEAARAGEQGKGFAVVAMEVRSLAEQSRQATAQVKAILSEIQKATNATVMATEEGTKGVDRGVQLAAQAREAIEQLASVINESAQIAVQVVVGGQQQASGIEQVALSMQNINQATVQSLASTRQAERSAQNLNDLSRSLSETVGQYRLN